MLTLNRIPARLRRAGASILAIGLILLFAIAASQAQQQDTLKARIASGPQAKYTAEGTERCVRCHNAERITDIANTPHGKLDNTHTPYAQHGCESCHGPGSLHASRARGGRGFPKLIGFGEEDPVEPQTEACMGCHGEDMGSLDAMRWRGSMHAVDGMTCGGCHELHIQGNPLQDLDYERELCAECHKRQIRNHRRFEDVGIEFDEVTCYECHDVHQLFPEQELVPD